MIKYRSLNHHLRIVVLWLMLGLIIEIIAKFDNSLNLFVYNIYTVIEVVLLGYLGYTYVDRRWVMAIIIAISCITISYLIISPSKFNSFILGIVSAYIIVICLCALKEIREWDEYDLFDIPDFIIIGSILGYYCTSLLVFILNDLFINNEQGLIFIWSMNAILNALFNVLITFGLWKVLMKRRLTS